MRIAVAMAIGSTALAASLCGASGAARQPETVQPVCKRPLGQKIRLEVRRLPSSFDARPSAAVLPAGVVKYPEQYRLSSPALHPAIDQYLAGASAIRLGDGCWLRIPFLDQASVQPASQLVVIRSPNAEGVKAAPHYPVDRPDVPGYDFVQAFPTYMPGYTSVGLWRSKARPVRTAIIAFGVGGGNAVIKVAALDLRAIATVPVPHGTHLGVYAISAPLRDGSVVALSLLWHP